MRRIGTRVVMMKTLRSDLVNFDAKFRLEPQHESAPSSWCFFFLIFPGVYPANFLLFEVKSHGVNYIEELVS